jgi:hypothetical protein
MSQHDYDIANQTGADTRTDLNNLFAAVVSLNSGATEPSATFAYMLWHDTTTEKLKQRNKDDDAWVTLFTLDQTNDGATALTTKIGSFTRDTTTASGTQAVTGVGFKPRLILFHYAQNVSNEMGVGSDNGTDKQNLRYDPSEVAWRLNTSFSIFDSQNVGTPTTYVGLVSSMDADGFTITWTKNGTPTGTLTIQYTAIK